MNYKDRQLAFFRFQQKFYKEDIRIIRLNKANFDPIIFEKRLAKAAQILVFVENKIKELMDLTT